MTTTGGHWILGKGIKMEEAGLRFLKRTGVYTWGDMSNHLRAFVSTKAAPGLGFMKCWRISNLIWEGHVFGKGVDPAFPLSEEVKVFSEEGIWHAGQFVCLLWSKEGATEEMFNRINIISLCKVFIRVSPKN